MRQTGRQTDDTSSLATHSDSAPCRVTGAILALAALLFACGYVLPVLYVKKFLFFSSESSLLGVSWGLLQDREFLLGGVLIVFTILFPITKLCLLAVIWWRPTARTNHLLQLLARLGRWSMLDVLVLALFVFSVKSSGLGTAFSQPGLYCFAGAVILTMIAVARLADESSEKP
ncbi:paraquat-inducible protein A [Iodidimonas gelatinilytica]|uniref:paraquat-inducible protein A n=1 Tax=Iodidimonas gelatinilytica TaxID=1236966 RepID=UPI001230D3E7|nr:paraquat-inducible protein A [Iodidimonas gelatinilytica]